MALIRLALRNSCLFLSLALLFHASAQAAQTLPPSCDAYLNKEIWKQFRVISLNAGNLNKHDSNEFRLGIPQSSAKLLQDLGILSRYWRIPGTSRLRYSLHENWIIRKPRNQFERWIENIPKYRQKHRERDLLDLRPIFSRLNQASKDAHQRFYADTAINYQRLVLLLFVGTETEGYEKTLWDPDTNEFFNVNGDSVEAPTEPVVFEPANINGEIATGKFLKAASRGLSIVAATSFVQHDIFGHFLTYIKHPELTPLRRIQMEKVGEALKYVRARTSGKLTSALELRALILDEYGYFSITDAVDPYTKRIGELFLPQNLLTTGEWRTFLNEGLSTGKIILDDLMAFAQTLALHQDEFIDRFGGSANDEYNDGRGDPKYDARYQHFKRAPTYALGFANQAVKRIEIERQLSAFGLGRFSKDKIETQTALLIEHLAAFMASARNKITNRELLEDAFWIEDEATYRASRAGQYFENVFGDTPRGNIMRAIFVELKEEWVF